MNKYNLFKIAAALLKGAAIAVPRNRISCPAIGANKSKKLTWLKAPAHNIRESFY